MNSNENSNGEYCDEDYYNDYGNNNNDNDKK